jgi:hypothetical protein
MNRQIALTIADEIEENGFSPDDTITSSQVFDREKVADIILRLSASAPQATAGEGKAT